MRLARFDDNRLGLVDGDCVRDVSAALDLLPAVRYPVPHGDLLIAHLDAVLERARDLAPSSPAVPLSRVVLRSPVANPGKIVGAPVNYQRHLDEVRGDGQLHHDNAINTIHRAGLFLKAASSVAGAGDGVALAMLDRRTDHEIELAVVIGRRARHVTRAEALTYVAGYCIGLDITIRGSEERSLRKSIDSYTVLGPYLATADEVGSPDDLDLCLSVNGEQRQSSNTRFLIKNVAELIEFASSFYTLHPGDVLMTGTPEGVAPLYPGDTIEATISRIGTMRVAIKEGRQRIVMTYRNLEDALQGAGNAVDMLRNSQIGPYAFPVVRHEFTNWRDEQRSWRETCALFDQSHHMTDLYVEGPDALQVLSDLAVNSFKNFKVNTAKQFVATNHRGHVIGDAILFYLSENRFNLVGRPPAANWVQFNIETGRCDARCERDERSAQNDGRRKTFRFQVQGPNALKVMAKILGKTPPEVRFFAMDTFRIGGRDVRALRHGMVGQPGWELFGPWEDGDAVRDAIVEAGQEFGIRQVGARTYPTSCLESGWIPSPLPAIYTGDEMNAYRQWLTGKSYEAMASLGGSFVSRNIEDYYLTPYNLGYGPFVKFDHDFVGRQALETMAPNPPRQKVTLLWNGDDVARAFKTMSDDGDITKYIDTPLANYATLPFDRVMKSGKVVGLSTYTGYTYNERSWLSLGIVNNEQAAPGTEVTIVWGEEGRGTTKPTVERHKQAEIRATVAPVPISEVARVAYRPK